MQRESKQRWVCLIAGALMMLFMGLIYAWSIFRQPLNAVFESWTPTELSITFTISMVFFCLGGFVSGKVLPLLKARWIVVISAALLLAGFVGVSFFDRNDPGKSLTMLYLFYGVLCGSGIGLSYNAILSTVTKWFPDRAGMASGVMLMGFGVGGMILGGAVTALISAYGLSTTFVTLGVVISVILAAGSFFLKPAPTTAPKDATASAARKEYSVLEMLRTPSFWLFALWIVLISASGLLIINSAAVIAVAFGAPALLGLIVSVFNGAGRVVMGVLFDKLGRKTSMLINAVVMAAAGAALLLGAVTKSAALIFIGLPLVGISYGGAPALTSATVLSFYGPKHFGVNLGTINFSVIIAANIGPLLSSAMQERSGGAYFSTFLMIVVLSVVAGAVGFLINTFSKKLEEV